MYVGRCVSSTAVKIPLAFLDLANRLQLLLSNRYYGYKYYTTITRTSINTY